MRIIKINKSVFVVGFVILAVVIPAQAKLYIEANDNDVIPVEIEKSLTVESTDFPFIKNEGQADSRISFYSTTGMGMAFITSSGELLYDLGYGLTEKGDRVRAALREHFKEGEARPIGFVEYNPRINYYLGNYVTFWRGTTPAYDTVKLGEVWPGVTVAIRSRNSTVEKYLEVQPGVDISRIKIEISYAHALKVRNDGHLVVVTDIGPVFFKEPLAYQIKEGQKVQVPISYDVNELTYGFKVSAYDSRYALYIDPLTLSGR